MWEIAFYAIGAAAAAAVALNLKGQLSEGGCPSCPYRGACCGGKRRKAPGKIRMRYCGNAPGLPGLA